jgi:hypothetical protein
VTRAAVHDDRLTGDEQRWSRARNWAMPTTSPDPAHRALPTGKADCRRTASRFSRCLVLTEDLPSVGVGWATHPGGLAHVNPLLKFPAGRQATASLAARQVRRRHRITVIRATGAPQNRSTTDRRECAGSGPPRRPCSPSFKNGIDICQFAGTLDCCGAIAGAEFGVDAAEMRTNRVHREGRNPYPPGSRHLGTCDDSGPVRRLTCSC